MTAYRCDAGRPLALTRRIAAGGEGVVWETDREGLVAKIYRTPGRERAAKLQAMIARPPALAPGHAAEGALAWPVALVEADGEADGPVGFLMRRVEGVPLASACQPRLRRRHLPGFDWLSLHAVAYNLAWLVGRLHAAGYVVGDLKPGNLLVDRDGLVAMVDLDSIQVTDRRQGRTFPAPTGSDGFTAPELIGRPLAELERTELHDRYALAAIVHLLLFAALPAPDAPATAPGPVGPQIAHPDLAAGFARAFAPPDGAARARPSAGDWCGFLATAIDDLRPCAGGSGHFHATGRGHCPWCARLDATGEDAFPPVPAEGMPKASLLKRLSAALADGDDEALDRLWSGSAWLRAQRLPPALQTRIAEAASRAEALARLRGLLRAGPASLADDDAAVRLWDGPPGLAHGRAAADRALAGGVEACRRRLRSARRLHAAIARARSAGALTPPGETEVVEAFREAIGVFELRPADLDRFRARAEEAAARLRAWHRLDRALAARDDAEAVAIWRDAAALLAPFAPAKAVAARLREARARVAAGTARRPQSSQGSGSVALAASQTLPQTKTGLVTVPQNP
jgi:hypothetical protein